MGLDMYAYAIDSRLVDDKWVTDCPVHRFARRAVGFIDLTDDEIEKLTEADRSAYWNKQREADYKAKEQGFFDPDFAYWRKFNALHGWMRDLYNDKGGRDPEFNCNTVRLNEIDLDTLQGMALAGELKPTEGFFFGPQEVNLEDLESINEFIDKARAAIADGKAVFYDSWW